MIHYLIVAERMRTVPGDMGAVARTSGMCVT
jgi:hypothetical protein